MGCIMSIVEAIDALRFKRLRKGRKTKVVEALRLDDRGTTLLKLADGSFTVAGPDRSNVTGNFAILGFGQSEPSRAVLDGLVSIGALKRREVTRHLERVHRAAEERQVKRDTERLESLADKLGYVLTKREGDEE